MRSCFFYIRQNDNPPNPEEIRKGLAEGTIDDKITILKKFIKCLVNDDTYPPMIMVVITNIIPLLNKHPELRKVMLLYWEVIQKNKSPNDPTLKDQMFLACNSLRSDLLSHNEYFRGRTLRLVSKIMHKGVIEPLSSAITENINHKSAYVRRNAVVCLYNVFCNFGSDVIGDIDEQIEDMLKTETDLSTKRNAFILLNKCNPQKAMDYLMSQISSDSLEDIGDILQIAILKVLKTKAREQPEMKSKFLKIINDFTYRAGESVLLQCSITSLAISNSVHSIKTSLSAYVSIFSRTNQLNVKKIILDKLETACKNSNYIDQALVEDLVKNLTTPSYEIKTKILNIATINLSPKIAELLLKQMKKQLSECTEDKYRDQILSALETISFKFPKIHEGILAFITQKVFKSGNISQQGANHISRAILEIFKKSKGSQLEHKYKQSVCEGFKIIKSRPLMKKILNIFGDYYTIQNQIQALLIKLQIFIGPLPIVPVEKSNNFDQGAKQQKKNKSHFKTKILSDGTYQTIEIDDEQQNEQMEEDQKQMHFRESLVQDSIMGGVFTRNVGKLLYNIRKNQDFNRFACPILMILCSLLRNYEERIYQTDQTVIDLISSLIRKVICPQQFINGRDPTYEKKELTKQLDMFFQIQDTKGSQVIEKNPQDLIFFRQLKKGSNDQEDEFDDEEVNQILTQKVAQMSFVDKLKSMVQLTGIFDPLYAQSFITINKYDLLFEILLMNKSKSNMLNVQIQFTSTAQILILQKAPSVNLRPNQSVMLRTQLRFTNNQLGLIYGYINYDNQAGTQQPYLITQQIKIDYMQFVVGERITENSFVKKWKQIQNNGKQQKIEVSVPQYAKMNYGQICKIIEKNLHCLQVSSEATNVTQAEEDDYFSNKYFYGKSKLGEFFMLTVTLFKDVTIDLTFSLRSQEEAIKNMIKNKIKDLQFTQNQVI